MKSPCAECTEPLAVWFICSQTFGYNRDGNLLYRHIAFTPVIVAPGQSRVVPLAPEFVQPQDGADKQDCELNAAKRWPAAWGDRYAPWGVTLLGDDLYCHQPLCEDALARGLQVLFVCKPDSHGTLYEWVSDFERSGDLQTLERTTWNVAPTAHRTLSLHQPSPSAQP
ncbi:hypothetical protein [Rhabdochromatium marinum]|uniref:hypothetical protein n=1 Tax=Rhabdochromatium marinum TaxID=48729 RepID=UPI00190791B5|nr:hypothetical protein [Rhabdochromatium marinum]